jgi:hypothetical protein
MATRRSRSHAARRAASARRYLPRAESRAGRAERRRYARPWAHDTLSRLGPVRVLGAGPGRRAFLTSRVLWPRSEKGSAARDVGESCAHCDSQNGPVLSSPAFAPQARAFLQRPPPDRPACSGALMVVLAWRKPINYLRTQKKLACVATYEI